MYVGNFIQVMVAYTVIGVRISTLHDTESNSFSQATLKSFFKPSSASLHGHAATTSCTTASDVDVIPENSTPPSPAKQCSVSHTPSLTICPICGSLVSTENLTLNQHIDECLNKPAIKDATSMFRGQSRGSSTPYQKKRRKNTSL